MPCRVLITEDGPSAAYTLAAMVSQFDCSIYMATNGSEALLLAMKHKPEVVLLDLAMPYMDGYEVARRLRDEQKYRGKIVAISGLKLNQEAIQAAGIDQYLRKPILLGQLARALGQTPPAGM